MFDNRFLEQRRHHRMHRVLETGEVVDAVERHGRLHPGVGVFESRLELRIIRRQRRQRRQVAAGRPAGDGDEVGVAAVLGDVRLDPREGALDVDDVVGPGVARAVPVVDRHADPAQLREVAHQRMGLSAFVSRRPGTAGDLEEHRRLSGRIEIGTSPDVQVVGAAVFAVADVRVVGVVTVDPQHPQRSRRLGGATAGRPAPQIRGVGAARGSQAAVQRGGQRHIGLMARATEVQQAQRRDARHQPRDRPHRPGQAAGCQRQPAELAHQCLQRATR